MMKNQKILKCILLLFIHLCPAGSMISRGSTDEMYNISAGKVVVYPALPGNQMMSDRYQVQVIQNGSSRNSYVYRDPNNDPRWKEKWPSDEAIMTLENHFTSFSFSGSVEVLITLPSGKEISSVAVRPLAKKITARIKNNTVSIRLKDPANLFVEIEGEKRYPLFIFANPIETDIPSPDDPGVIYFGPGIHDIGIEGGPAQNIPVGKTIYLAGGAYVKGVIKTTGEAGTTTIRGRGILSGIDIKGYSTYKGMIESRRGALNVEGIIIADAPQGYQGIIAYGDGSLVENVRFLVWAMESDGGVLGKDSKIINCFFKINDDVLKPISDGILYKDNIVWQQMCGTVICLGWNSTGQIKNATVSGLDIIGCDRGAKPVADWTNQAIINLRNSNGAVIRGMTIENVRIEKRAHMLFAIDIKVTSRTGKGFVNDPRYNKGLGTIDGLILRNFIIPQEPLTISYFNGNGNVTPESSGDIRNVTFENINIAGARLSENNAGKYLERMGNTSGFTFK